MAGAERFGLACAVIVLGVAWSAASPSAHGAARNVNDVRARWTESLGVPSIYVERARTDLRDRHYGAAARDLRRAASMLERRSERVYGLDRSRLGRDAAALRLTARDVAAAAVKTPAELDSVLDDTHADLRER